MQFNKFDFRVWHTKKLAFIDNLGFTSKYHAEIATYSLLQDNGKWQTYNDTHLLEIELWSGFYDVNNKKIYEGDIVQYKGQNRVCVYECATFYLIEPLIEKEFQVDCGTRLQRLYETGSLSNTEVIGNICENLNLIKGANHVST